MRHGAGTITRVRPTQEDSSGREVQAADLRPATAAAAGRGERLLTPELPEAVEACAFLLDARCVARGGATDSRDGYLAIVDGRPLFACEGCRALVKKPSGRKLRS